MSIFEEILSTMPMSSETDNRHIFAANMYDIMAKNGVTKTKVSDICQIPLDRIDDYLSGTVDAPTLKEMCDISDGLGIGLHEMLQTQNWQMRSSRLVTRW